MMMMVFSSSVFVNRIRRSAVSCPKGGRSSGSGCFLSVDVEKSTAYRSPRAVIEGVPATWVSPDLMATPARRRRMNTLICANARRGGSARAQIFICDAGDCSVSEMDAKELCRILSADAQNATTNRVTGQELERSVRRFVQLPIVPSVEA
jgi:hypothetical protein